MKKNILLYFNRIKELLWVKPLIFCLISVGAALMAHQADKTGLNELVPDIKTTVIERLLNIISSSMLVISTFSVTSMLSAFSSASNSATPRSFKIVVTDDVSQYALSTFIGAFIYSIVATVALNYGYYGKAGKFILFLLTLILFALVILTFLRWVDRISRLGRLEHTINQVEVVTKVALSNYVKSTTLNGLAISDDTPKGLSIFGDAIGYVQHVNMYALQDLAEESDIQIRLQCIPGKFIHENSKIAYVTSNGTIDLTNITKKINDAIEIGHTRLFDEDPRFGFITLSEIASRALSPGVNDPGTAIQIIGTIERLLFLWNETREANVETTYNRIQVPEIAMIDFFDDAFRPISRDGANNIEVMLRLQKTFNALETIPNSEIKKGALKYSQYAYESAESSLILELDRELLKKSCLYKP